MRRPGSGFLVTIIPNEPGTTIHVKTIFPMLTQILPDIVSHLFATRAHRQHLAPPKIIIARVLPPPGPFVPECWTSRPIISPGHGSKIKSGADVRRQTHQQVKVNPSRLLALRDHNPLAVTWRDYVRQQR